MKKKILLIAGTRPNFIKLAPLYHTLKTKDYEVMICHTGQHYDVNMFGQFWDALQLPVPDYSLNVRGKNVPDTIGKTMVQLSELFDDNDFDLVIVFGDVNATVAGAVTAAQTHISVMHVEAGLRSYDRLMPEEINRVITDHVSDFLMISEQSGIENLKNEGISNEKVFFVGNIMIENLLQTKSKWQNIEHSAEINNLISKNDFALATFHRPENVDKKEDLQKVVTILNSISEKIKVILPLHPRTHKKLNSFELFKELNTKNILITEPLDYFSFINLVSKSTVVITDSGGVQEETSYLKIPCLTFRKNTERPITVEHGTNILISVDNEQVVRTVFDHIEKVKNSNYKEFPSWDIDVSKRIEKVISEVL